jgi:hypothetical protein
LEYLLWRKRNEMKTKHFFNVVMAALIAAIFSVLTGCATGSAASPDQAATKLVAAINAVKPGSAQVSSGTVTLTGDVRLETALAVPGGVTFEVPAGVTLDLTAAGAALELQDGAVLTVNGTVNARSHVWGAAGSLLFDRTAVINGSGSINLKSKGELLFISKNQKLTLDGVTLAGLEDNDDSLVMVYDGGELVMISGAITGNTRTGDEWAGGGAVFVENSVFTMQGGAISGNTLKGKWSYGGGVYLEDGSTFTMTGGAITDNTTIGGGYATGGGVYICDGSTFTMTGGEIAGNNVINLNEGGDGGGVYADDGTTFTMTGGTIWGNRVTAPYSSGGGVYVIGSEDGSNPATFIMEGGAIFGNSTTSPIDRATSGGVDVRYATFILKGGRIQGNADSDGFAKNVGSYKNSAALFVYDTTAKWGTGGAYTKGGVPQTGGGDIMPTDADGGGGTNDTLIAVPAQ